jgi:nicotinamidase-related amidase
MNENRHTQQSATALVLVDVINHFEFPDGDRLLRQASSIAAPLARLKNRARSAEIPTIYVNDNFGQWRSNASELLHYCLRPESVGRTFVNQVQPHPEDYLVLKPKNSAFYQTPLEILLEFLGASSIILCGLATNSCVLATAHDANMRDLRLFIPSDCSASRSLKEHRNAIQHVQAMANANIAPSSTLRLDRLRFGVGEREGRVRTGTRGL